MLCQGSLPDINIRPPIWLTLAHIYEKHSTSSAKLYLTFIGSFLFLFTFIILHFRASNLARRCQPFLPIALFSLGGRLVCMTAWQYRQQSPLEGIIQSMFNRSRDPDMQQASFAPVITGNHSVISSSSITERCRSHLRPLSCVWSVCVGFSTFFITNHSLFR